MNQCCNALSFNSIYAVAPWLSLKFTEHETTFLWVALPPLGLMSRLFDRGTQWVPLVISGKRVCCLYIQGSHSFMNTRFKDFQGLFKAPFILYQAPIKFTLQHIVSCNTLQYLTFHLNLTFTLTKFRVIMFWMCRFHKFRPFWAVVFKEM